MEDPFVSIKESPEVFPNSYSIVVDTGEKRGKVSAVKCLDAAAGDIVCPPVYSYLPSDSYSIDYYSKIKYKASKGFSTRSALEAMGYDIVNPGDVSIRDMGEIGEGGFANVLIRKGRVLGVYAGFIDDWNYKLPRHSTFSRSISLSGSMLGSVLLIKFSMLILGAYLKMMKYSRIKLFQTLIMKLFLLKNT
jgi:hypothetical protein